MTTGTQLSAAQQRVADLRAQLTVVGVARRQKTETANSLIPKIKAGDTKAEKQVIALDREIDAMQAEETALQATLQRDVDILRHAEAEARFAQHVLTNAEAEVAIWLPVKTEIEAGLVALNAVNSHLAKYRGYLNQPEQEGLQRALGLLGRAAGAFTALEEAQEIAALRGLPE